MYYVINIICLKNSHSVRLLTDKPNLTDTDWSKVAAWAEFHFDKSTEQLYINHRQQEGLPDPKLQVFDFDRGVPVDYKTYYDLHP